MDNGSKNNSNYKIVTDSTIDLSYERMCELRLPFARLTINIDGNEFYDDMREETKNKLFSAMREGKVPRTSQAAIQEFLDIFTMILKEGRDIFYIAFPRVLSGTINSAEIARKELLAEYPDRRIEIIDSLCASIGAGTIVENALMYQKSGATLDECIKAVEGQRLKITHLFTVDDLAYLRRGGRISGVAALVGSMIALKPILSLNEEGKIVSKDKIKGRRASIKHLVKLLKETYAGTGPINILHASCEDGLEQLTALVRETMGDVELKFTQVGTTVGAHVGPGTLGLIYETKKR